MNSQAAIIAEVLAPIHRVVPALAAAWDGSGWHPSHAAELRRASEVLRPAVLALAGLVADLVAAGDGAEGGACYGCCGAGTGPCQRCGGSGAEVVSERAGRE